MTVGRSLHRPTGGAPRIARAGDLKYSPLADNGYASLTSLVSYFFIKERRSFYAQIQVIIPDSHWLVSQISFIVIVCILETITAAPVFNGG